MHSSRDMATALTPLTVAAGDCKGVRYIEAREGAISPGWIQGKEHSTYGHIVLTSRDTQTCVCQLEKCAASR